MFWRHLVNGMVMYISYIDIYIYIFKYVYDKLPTTEESIGIGLFALIEASGELKHGMYVEIIRGALGFFTPKKHVVDGMWVEWGQGGEHGGFAVSKSWV